MKLNTIHHRRPGSHSQAGAALAISLIMLLLLTIIGVTAMQSTTMQERMAGNARERSTTFQIAEAALRDGERYLDTNPNPTFTSIGSSSTNGLYFENTTANDAWYLTKMLSTASSATGTVGNSAYVIEELAPVPPIVAGTPVTTRHYRITARGTGPAGTSVVLLQSIYKR
jgi:type IV pilus assembly protein PilX